MSTVLFLNGGVSALQKELSFQGKGWLFVEEEQLALACEKC